MDHPRSHQPPRRQRAHVRLSGVLVRAKGAGELPSFDDEPFVAEARAAALSLDNLLAEWRTVRASNLSLFETIDEAASANTVIASGNRFTARAFPWIIAVNEIHHRKQLKDRYLAREWEVLS